MQPAGLDQFGGRQLVAIATEWYEKGIITKDDSRGWSWGGGPITGRYLAAEKMLGGRGSATS